MSHGFKARNVTGRNITIDANHISYVYLAKYVLPSQIGNCYVEFGCVGTPQVYFDVPYNVTGWNEGNPDSYSTYGGPKSLNQQSFRVGVAMHKLESIGTNLWRAHFLVNNPNGPDLGLYIRVFGKLHLNHVPPTGVTHGLRIRKPGTTTIVFDSTAPMLDLAGDTYDTEILLTPDTPLVDTDYPNAKDAAITLPFNMTNKSILATTRGMIFYPYYVTSYYDVGAGQWMSQYDIAGYTTMYWANGTTLYARRIPVSVTPLVEPGEGGMYIDNSNCVNTYSRLAVIDNSRYP